MKREDIVRIIEDKYDRYAREVIALLAGDEEAVESESPHANIWEKWRVHFREATEDEVDPYCEIAMETCRKVVSPLEQDELELLWQSSEDSFQHGGRRPIFGMPLTKAVTDALFKRLRRIAAEPRLKLEFFIMQLVDAWKDDHREDEELPSAVELCETIWAAPETVPAFVESDANTFTIADVLQTQTIEYFGGVYWSEMEDYINRLTPMQSNQMNLREFIECFYSVLRDFGTPD